MYLNYMQKKFFRYFPNVFSRELHHLFSSRHNQTGRWTEQVECNEERLTLFAKTDTLKCPPKLIFLTKKVRKQTQFS
jgi:hypothetical protein